MKTSRLEVGLGSVEEAGSEQGGDDHVIECIHEEGDILGDYLYTKRI